ncbi:ABC transporter ATP-binding protein [Methylophaga nitratireducenticrescens]|uniref:ABC transporter ATP-binding protein n=1 Tax=Methylophaga nitratireducenticrescens TaxID=754476 RepID=I1XJF9_METNJ|nr:ABC transporter ATP-binding protein [Methylophaga nitratireducenticrescens]AFI84528.1 ABC transporter ATP-binding protein [Methylophaga nitratireducenticrescens]
MLEVNQLTKSFGNRIAVDHLDFKIASGEVLCLLGANGAGKTTTLNMLLGFTAPTSGSATLEGQDLYQQSSSCRQKIMYVPENVNLYPRFDAIENIHYLAVLAKMKLTDQQVHEALISAGLKQADFSKHLAEYSKGMRQKVAIAFALLKHARLILMDEPTSGLDPVATQDFIQVVNTIKSRGAAVLIVTHDLLCAHQLADRIGIMKQGHLTDLITTQTLTLDQLTQRYFDQFAA